MKSNMNVINENIRTRTRVNLTYTYIFIFLAFILTSINLEFWMSNFS